MTTLQRADLLILLGLAVVTFGIYAQLIGHRFIRMLRGGIKDCFGEAAETSTRAACAPQSVVSVVRFLLISGEACPLVLGCFCA